MADFDVLYRAAIDATEALRGAADYVRAQEKVNTAARDSARAVAAAGRSAADAEAKAIAWRIQNQERLAAAQKALDSQRGGAFMSGFNEQLGGVAASLRNAAAEGIGFRDVLMGAVGGAVASAVTAGIGAITGALKGLGHGFMESVRAAAEAEQAVRRLEVALELRGALQASRGLQELAAQLQATTRYDDEAIMGLQQLGLSIGVPIGKMQEFTRASVDLASALGVDLSQAAQQIAMTLDGTIGRLGERVPELKSLTAEELRSGAAIDVIGAKMKGFATSEVQTLGGAFAQLKNQFGEVSESFGRGVSESADLAAALRGLTAWIAEKAIPAARELGDILGTAIRGNSWLGDVVAWVAKLVEYSSPLVLVAKAFREMRNAIASGGVDENADSANAAWLERRKLGAGGKAAADERSAAQAAADEQNLNRRREEAEVIRRLSIADETATAVARRDIESLKIMHDAGALDAEQYWGAIFKVREAERKAAQERSDATRKAIAEQHEWAQASPLAAGALNQINLPMGEHLDLLTQIEAAGAGYKKKLAELWSQGQIHTVEEYRDRVQEVEAALSAVAQAGSSMRQKQIDDFAVLVETTGSRAMAESLMEKQRLVEQARGNGAGSSAAKLELGKRSAENAELDRQNALLVLNIRLTGDRAAAQSLMDEALLRRQAGIDDAAQRRLEALEAEREAQGVANEALIASIALTRDKASAQQLVNEALLRQQAAAGVVEAQQRVAVINAEREAQDARNQSLIEYIALVGDRAAAERLVAQEQLDRAAAAGVPGADGALALQAEEQSAFDEKMAREMQLIELGATRAQAEAMVTEELLRQAAAQGDVVAKQQLAVIAADRQAQAFNRQKASMQLLTQASTQVAQGLVQMAISGEGSVKKLLVATLTSIATESVGKAIFEVAEAHAAAARYDAPSAANHMAAAVFYGKVAAVAGGAAAAINIASGDYGGKKRGRGDDDVLGGRDASLASEPAAQPPPPAPPVITVHVLGPVVGGTRDELGRSLTDVVGTALAESGYRQPTPRSGGP